EQCLYLLFAPCLVERAIDERPHAAVLVKVCVDELLGLGRLNAKVLRKSEGREPVHNAEVHNLGLPAMVGGDHQRRQAKHLRGGGGGDVITPPVCLHQKRIFGKMREQPQFNLRIICGQKHVPRLGGERGPNFAAQFGADRNVLQIRIGGGQPSGRG